MCKKLAVVMVLILLPLLLVLGCRSAAPTEKIKIGCVLSETGYLAETGTKMMKAARLAVMDINAEGGVLGKEVELFEEDDRCEPARCLEAVKKLVTVNGVKALVGGMTSGASMATGPYLSDQGILMVSPSATSPLISEQAWTKWLFRTCLHDALQGEALARVVKEKGYKRVGTMVQDNPYGMGLEKGFIDALKGEVEHVVSIHYDPKKMDYRTELGQIKAANPDVVLAVTYADDGIVIFRQALEMGLDEIDWLGCDGNYSIGMFKDPKCAEFMEKAIVAGTRSAPTSGAVWEKFRASYVDEFGTEPEVYSDTTYDAVRLIAKAIEEAGVYEGEAIRDALLEIGKEYEGVSGVITFDERGDRVSGEFEVWKVEKVEGVYKNVRIKMISL